MLNINIICVGKLKEKYLKDALNEYIKRLSRYCKLTITELPDEKIPDKLNPNLEIDIKTKETHVVNGLEEGKTYILREEKAPYGYETAENITFTASTDKEMQVIVIKDMPILKNIKIIKVDAETKEIIKDKFTFAIYENQECTSLIKEIESNKEEGTAIFEELRFGTYFIKEIKAPKGYELSDKIVKVEINDKGIFIDNELAEESNNTIEFSFENKKIEVPQTGDNSHVKLALGILLLAILGTTYLGLKIYKSHKDNKNK